MVGLSLMAHKPAPIQVTLRRSMCNRRAINYQRRTMTTTHSHSLYRCRTWDFLSPPAPLSSTTTSVRLLPLHLSASFVANNMRVGDCRGPRGVAPRAQGPFRGTSRTHAALLYFQRLCTTAGNNGACVFEPGAKSDDLILERY